MAIRKDHVRFERKPTDFHKFSTNQGVKIFMGNSWTDGFIHKIYRDRVEIRLEKGRLTSVYDARNIVGV